MIYEIRMTVVFLLQSYDNRGKGDVDTKRVKSTLIEYVNADSICNAYLEADKLKNGVILTLLKKMNKCTHLSISLDVLVAKPELEGKVHETIKCYNTKCWNLNQTTNECRQYYCNIDKCSGQKGKLSEQTKFVNHGVALRTIG